MLPFSTPVGPVVAAVAWMATPPSVIVHGCIDIAQGQGMAERDQLSCSFGCLYGSEARYFKRIALRIMRKRGDYLSRECDEG